MSAMDPQPRLQPDRSAPLRAADWTERRLYAFGGLAFDAVDLDEAVARVERAIRQRERLFVSTPNTNFLIATQKDAAFRRSVLLSDLVVPDGMPIVWMARLLGLPVKGRVTGADLYEQLVERANLPINVFFFGGPDGAAQEAMARLNARGTCVRGVGALSPGFGSMDSLSTPLVLDQINASNADLLVVALGAKRGQEWILRNLDRLNVPVVSHLGAVVNFAAGRVRRAPKWMGWAGIEWLWRIREEPGLWRRYASDAIALSRFFAASKVLQQFIKDRLSEHDDVNPWPQAGPVTALVKSAYIDAQPINLGSDFSARLSPEDIAWIYLGVELSFLRIDIHADELTHYLRMSQTSCCNSAVGK